MSHPKALLAHAAGCSSRNVSLTSAGSCCGLYGCRRRLYISNVDCNWAKVAAFNPP